MNELDLYSELILNVLNKSAVKRNKWRENFMLEVLLLYLIIPERINITGGMINEKSSMISCNDGFRPVSFLIEALEEDAE